MLLLNDQPEIGGIPRASISLHWGDCNEEIDLAGLAAKEPILFYDEVGI